MIPENPHPGFAWNPEITRTEWIEPDTISNKLLSDAVQRNDFTGVETAFSQRADPDTVVRSYAIFADSRVKRDTIPFVHQIQLAQCLCSDSWSEEVSTEIFHEFLRQGVSVNAARELPNVGILHATLQYRNFELIQSVVGKGADVNHVAEMLGVPMCSISIIDDEEQQLRILRYLLEHGADPNVFSPMAGTTLLIVAAADGQAEVVALLLRYGADKTRAAKLSTVHGGGPYAGKTALDRVQKSLSAEVLRKRPNLAKIAAAQEIVKLLATEEAQ